MNFIVPKHRNRDDAKVGETVLKFQCDGCMASDHKFQWAGQIVRFEPADGDNMKGYHYAIVKIVRKDHLDWRDQDLGEEKVVVEDGSFQRLGPNLFGYNK